MQCSVPLLNGETVGRSLLMDSSIIRPSENQSESESEGMVAFSKYNDFVSILMADTYMVDEVQIYFVCILRLVVDIINDIL